MSLVPHRTPVSATIPRPGRAARPARIALLAAALVAGGTGSLQHGGPARAFETLNEAQTLVYDRAHLAALATGDEVVYRYEASVDERGEIEDSARLQVDGETDAERRDVTLDFLSGERRLELPPFEGYRGNPVLIAMLEHIAQSLSNTSGGGALYFRNRIRDALAGESAAVETGSATFGGTRIDTTTLAFEPFRNDAYLGARPGFGGASFRIVFSDDVPGGVVSIAASSAESAAADEASSFDYELRLADPS